MKNLLSPSLKILLLGVAIGAINTVVFMRALDNNVPIFYTIMGFMTGFLIPILTMYIYIAFKKRRTK